VPKFVSIEPQEDVLLAQAVTPTLSGAVVVALQVTVTVHEVAELQLDAEIEPETSALTALIFKKSPKNKIKLMTVSL
jgi:hypothetical protein